LQFKGSLRSPGDRGPGIRVSLVVDDYHLEILRGSDMMGRWYLADVEVKREIAERFTLFLGDDEMEFLADDALVFAYEGVTRMQQGWVNAKKRKRRHRRAAADAARRKDEAPQEPEPVVEGTEEPQPTTRKVPTSDLAKKLAAIASAEAAASESEKRRFTWAEAEALELSASAEAKLEPKPAPKKPRKKAPTKPTPVEPLFTEAPVLAATEPTASEPVVLPPRSVEPPTTETPPAAAVSEVSKEEAAPPEVVVKKRRRPPKPPIEELAEPDYPEPSWIAPPPARVVTVDLSVEEPVVIETPLRVEELPESLEPVDQPVDQPVEDDAEDELTRRRQRRKNRRESTAEDQPPAEENEDRKITDLEAARGKVREPKGAGHHPAETNVGLLAKLRRPPKADQEHVHTYQESRSAGGLTRRVCLECNHVSITSDD
jgi:hypothetical protein